MSDPTDAQPAPSDIGRLDAPSIDATPSVDAPPMDAPAELDVPIEPIDAGMDAPLDAGSDTPAPPTCNELFMAVIPVYQNCGPPPEPGTCRFYTDPEPNASCDTLCGLVPGSTCVRSEADDDTRCASTAHHACDLPQGDTICVCRRP